MYVLGETTLVDRCLHLWQKPQIGTAGWTGEVYVTQSDCSVVVNDMIS